MEDTIFMKIIRREIPADIVYEDADTLAFLDANPDSPGHTLVIPKKPFRNIFDIDPRTIGALIVTAQKIAKVLKEAVGAEGVTLVMNNEHPGGQFVFHAHIHVIPRRSNDGLRYAENGSPYRAGEAAAIAAKIRQALT